FSWPASRRFTSSRPGHMRPSSVIRVIVLALLVLSGRARAQNFFTTSPGPLSSSHGALDDQNHCNDCHVDGTSEVSNSKCLDCHDHQNLRARINAGKGYHATGGIKGKDCKTCHKDHKG